MNLYDGLTVLDTETTDLNSKTAEVCQVATAQFDGFEWKGTASYYGTVDPIPYKASAKNHISRRMLNGLPTFLQDQTSSLQVLNYDSTRYYVAHNSAYDKSVLVNRFADQGLTWDKEFICTLRCADKLYDWLELKNLSYLRYALELNVPDDVIAHRAEADVLVTSALLEQIIKDAIDSDILDPNLSVPIADQLYKWCWAAKPVSVFPFGKHKGEALVDVPTDYYLWAIDNSNSFNANSDQYDVDLTTAVTKVLEGRIQ